VPGEPDPRSDQFKELLQELRVVLPGVQLLLAFLLTVPFDARFELLSDADRALYGVAIVSAVVAVVFLIAPTAQHRIAWWRGAPDYDRLLPLGSTEALLGMAGVAVSTVASAYVVIDFVYHEPVGAAAGALIAALIAWLWLIEPLRIGGHRG
jgi:hypothetical protein